MELRIEDCIQLQNWRQRAKNKKDGKQHFHNVLNKATLSRLFWPNNRKKDAPIRMSKFLKEGKTFRPEWIEILCRESGVDPNFVFGFPSIHDEDFKKSVL